MDERTPERSPQGGELKSRTAEKARRRIPIRAKWIVLSVILFLGAAAGIARLVLPRWVDAPQVRAFLCEQIRDATGLEAVLGALEVKSLGGLEVEGRSLALQVPGTDQTIIEIPEIRARLDGEEALRGRLVIRSLAVGGLVASLDRLPPPREDEPSAEARMAALLALFPRVRLSNARFTWTVGRQRIWAHVAVGEIDASGNTQRVDLRGRGEIGGPHGAWAAFRTEGFASPKGASQLTVSLERVSLPALAASWAPVGLSHDLRGHGDITLRMEGTPQAGRCQGRWELQSLRVDLPRILDTPFETPQASTNFAVHWSDGEWSVELDRFRADWLSLKGRIQKGSAGIRGSVTTSPFSFQDVIPHLGQGFIGRNLYAFFRRNLEGGEGLRTTFLFHPATDLEDPSTAMVLLMELDFRGASLSFDPGLEPLRDLSGTLLWQGDKVWFRDLQGTYRGHPVGPMEAKITEIGRVSLLEGRFALEMTPSELMGLFQTVAPRGVGLPANLTLEGQSSLDLTLRKPFLTEDPLDYAARISLKQVKGSAPGVPQGWRISHGDILATPRRLEILDLRAGLEGVSGETRGVIEDWADGSPKLALQGRAEVSMQGLNQISARIVPGLGISAKGTSFLTFSLVGPPISPVISLTWDLGRVGLGYGEHWDKPEGVGLILDASLQRVPGGAWRVGRLVARGEGGELHGEGWLGGGPGERGWLHVWAERFPIDLAVKQFPALRGKIRGGEMGLRGELYWGKESHWMATMHPRHITVPKEILGHEIRIPSGNLVLAAGWSVADPLEIEVLGKRYSLWGRLRPEGKGFHLEARLQGEELHLDPWIFPDTSKGRPDQDRPSTDFPMKRWLDALPSSHLDLQFGGMKLLNLIFRDLRGRLAVRNDRLVLEDAVARLEGGPVAATGHLDAQGRFWLGGGVDDARAGPVLSKLGFQEQIIDGPLHLQVGVEGKLQGRFAGRHEGNIELEIGKGIIRKFPVLANILSLMNFSQILTGRLPDLSREGMIFNRIVGSFSLKDGLARTEDFRVESEAMVLTMLGDLDLMRDACDLKVGVQPFVGFDRFVSKIPVVRHYLEGPERSVLTTYFLVRGPLKDPEVTAIPFRSLGERVVGILRRLLQNPFQDLGGSPGWPPIQVPEPPSQ